VAAAGGGTWGVVTRRLLALGRLCLPFCLADNGWRMCVVCVFVFLFSSFSLSFLLAQKCFSRQPECDDIPEGHHHDLRLQFFI